MKRILALVLMGVLIGGCATTPPLAPESGPAASFAQRSAALKGLDDWNLQGHAAITTPDDSGTVSLDWRQRGSHYRIELQAPLGAGGVLLEGDKRSVTLKASDGTSKTASDATSLLRRYTGFPLPVAELRAWLLGLPAEGSPYRMKLDKRNRLARLQQDGWDIRYLRYGRFGDLDLPTKVFADGPRIHVRVAVNRWSFAR